MSATSTRRPRGPNKFVYKYHFHGTLNGVAIDEKHTSLNSFVEKWGGTHTPLGLNRQKLHRILTGFYDDKRPCRQTRLMRSMWQVQCESINEPRPYKRTSRTKVLVVEPSSPSGAESFDRAAPREAEALISDRGEGLDVFYANSPNSSTPSSAATATAGDFSSA